MSSKQLADYLWRIRLTNNPARLAAIRAELDREHPHGPDSEYSDALVVMATIKRRGCWRLLLGGGTAAAAG